MDIYHEHLAFLFNSFHVVGVDVDTICDNTLETISSLYYGRVHSVYLQLKVELS